jgi:hypothetical protein
MPKKTVMPGLDPGTSIQRGKIAGSSSAMTVI